MPVAHQVHRLHRIPNGTDRKRAFVPPDLARQLKHQHERWSPCPEWSEEGHRVDLVDDSVEVATQRLAIVSECSPVDTPLAPRPHNSNTVYVLSGGRAGKRAAKPFDLVPLVHEAPSDFIGERLRSTSARITWTAPIEDQYPQIQPPDTTPAARSPSRPVSSSSRLRCW